MESLHQLVSQWDDVIDVEFHAQLVREETRDQIVLLDGLLARPRRCSLELRRVSIPDV